MNREDIQNILEQLHSTISLIQDSADPALQETIEVLLNLIETLGSENEELKEENQKLKDEINRLKGEQGKPDIKGKNQKQKNTDLSSEDERNGDRQKDKDEPDPKKRKRKRSPKLPRIKINREQICPVDKSELPNDVVFKGYDDVVIQDIKIVTDNVRYRREIYYSPSRNKSYRGQLPKGIEGKGEYGTGVRSLIPLLKSECNMSEPRILSFFENFDIHISKTYISSQWTKGYTCFHDEKEAIFHAGLESTRYQQADDTGARVNGENHYTHIFCNPYYTAFFTLPRKDRLTLLDILTGHAPRQFLYNQTAIEFLKNLKLSKKLRHALDEVLEKKILYTEEEFEQQLDDLTDNIKIGPNNRTRIKEACAIAAYWQQTDIPVIDILMSDDAPQFGKITPQHILCWIHDGRHYKKLRPFVKQHQVLLKTFRKKYWLFYHRLKDYKKTPSPELATQLEQEFDVLFSTKTHYQDLDERIKKTLAKKDKLLLVLKYPELPLHNNASELGARVQVRDRDVSLHTKSKEGTKIKDTFMTIKETARKLGVSVYLYIHDRVSERYKLPSLADLIKSKSRVSEG